MLFASIVALSAWAMAAPRFPIAKVTKPALAARDVTGLFQNATFSNTIGGNASCISGHIPITASASNMNITIDGFASGSSVTQWIADNMYNTNIAEIFNGGMHIVSGTYNIQAQLCIPMNVAPNKESFSLQFLTSGITFDSSYWQLAVDSSYIDLAAGDGYATFRYDRIGSGNSDYPDPIQTVQSFIHVAIAHQLVQFLRNTSLRGYNFNNVIGVGQSFGSALTIGIAANYPADFDAMILTGYSLASATTNAKLAAFALQTAPSHPSGYLTLSSRPGYDLTFLTHPNYNTALADRAYETRNPLALGELLTIASVVAPSSNFTGPVMLLDGERVYIFCAGHCDNATLAGPDVLARLFPGRDASVSRVGLVQGVGHVIGLHWGAEEAAEMMGRFLGDCWL